jgi:hypothetical protein
VRVMLYLVALHCNVFCTVVLCCAVYVRYIGSTCQCALMVFFGLIKSVGLPTKTHANIEKEQ